MKLHELKDRIKALERTHVEYRKAAEVLQALQQPDAVPDGIITHIADIAVRFTGEEGITALTRHCKQLADKIYDACYELQLDYAEFVPPGGLNAE